MERLQKRIGKEFDELSSSQVLNENVFTGLETTTAVEKIVPFRPEPTNQEIRKRTYKLLQIQNPCGMELHHYENDGVFIIR